MLLSPAFRRDTVDVETALSIGFVDVSLGAVEMFVGFGILKSILGRLPEANRSFLDERALSLDQESHREVAL